MRTNKCKRKPYWSEELQDSWNKTCDAERQWKRCKSIGKSKLRTRFMQSRKDFDKLNRKAKRNYQLEQQNKLQKLGEQNSSEFWKSIGKLGLANDRKSRQTFQIRSETGEIISDIDSVLEKWKIDFIKLYKSADMNGSFQYVKYSIEYSNFIEEHCSALVLYTRTQLRVYYAQLDESTNGAQRDFGNEIYKNDDEETEPDLKVLIQQINTTLEKIGKGAPTYTGAPDNSDAQGYLGAPDNSDAQGYLGAQGYFDNSRYTGAPRFNNLSGYSGARTI
ncbi:unnamed protein product [Mytilus edulis]|uniref:Uncharacterized protein n=1 Tax=Mytilus edulis TaxID=6550 RepID=A0A8S3R093_MYTED|nr:unnamed protein product [Mytilus edulis]